MNIGGITDEQYDRLEIARKTKKYGHLMSWKEIFLFQAHYANEKQRGEIIDWAHRKSSGEPVYLPLMDMKTGGEIE